VQTEKEMVFCGDPQFTNIQPQKWERLLFFLLSSSSSSS